MGCSCFLIYHPLEAVCCNIVLGAAGAFKPVLISIGLPLAAIAVGMIAAGCRDRIGFQYALADGAFLMLRTVSGSRCSGVDDPVAGGMSFLTALDNHAAANNFAYFPMVICIRLPLAASNMGMLLPGVFSAPVGIPSAAYHTDAMAAACRNAVCFTAILAQTAEFADRTAFGAGLTALHTNSRAVFAGAAIGADGTALFAGISADGADFSAGCTVIAGLAETLRLLQTFLTSGAVLVLIEGAFNAHFTFIAPFVHALTAASAAAGTGLIIHKAVAAFNAVTAVVFGTVDAHFAVCADITACTVGTQ